ncbi:MAG: hypothetical protein RR505_14300 [Raoultibacter sp.]
MKKTDTEFSLQTVPQSNRNSFAKTMAVMLGFTFFSASMLAGGQLGLNLTYSQFLLVILLGNLALCLYTGALAHIAAYWALRKWVGSELAWQCLPFLSQKKWVGIVIY